MEKKGTTDSQFRPSSARPLTGSVVTTWLLGRCSESHYKAPTKYAFTSHVTEKDITNHEALFNFRRVGGLANVNIVIRKGEPVIPYPHKIQCGDKNNLLPISFRDLTGVKCSECAPLNHAPHIDELEVQLACLYTVALRPAEAAVHMYKAAAIRGYAARRTTCSFHCPAVCTILVILVAWEYSESASAAPRRMLPVDHYKLALTSLELRGSSPSGQMG